MHTYIYFPVHQKFELATGLLKMTLTMQWNSMKLAIAITAPIFLLYLLVVALSHECGYGLEDVFKYTPTESRPRTVGSPDILTAGRGANRRPRKKLMFVHLLDLFATVIRVL